MTEMLAPWLIAVALYLLYLGLRGLPSRWAFQLADLSFLGTIYAIGYAVGRAHEWGTAFVLGWFAWRIVSFARILRRWRAPGDVRMEPCRPPNSTRFPGLRELTDELEELGFEEREDIGTESEDHFVFTRLMGRGEEKLNVAIGFHEEPHFAFYYLSFISRDAEGNEWITWNHPFPPPLLVQPEVKIQQLDDIDVAQMLEAHRKFFAATGREAVAVEDPVAATYEANQRMLAYNFEKGILLPGETEGDVRYSWRGVWLAMRQAWRR